MRLLTNGQATRALSVLGIGFYPRAKPCRRRISCCSDLSIVFVIGAKSPRLLLDPTRIFSRLPAVACALIGASADLCSLEGVQHGEIRDLALELCVEDRRPRWHFADSIDVPWREVAAVPDAKGRAFD